MQVHQFTRVIKHLWLDAADTRRAMPPAMLDRLTQRVADSETRHSGQIRICVEAALPMSYLWRQRAVGMPQLIRQRALMLFGKLRVWDTEHNNGVLVYLLLAERAIEIVADRGLTAHVEAEDWQAMSQRMGAAFQAVRFEDGLSQAIGDVSALLVSHFPRSAGQQQRNELPDQPAIG